jgi:1,4-dihydroxy-2-naphthoate octaprenyltransferase
LVGAGVGALATNILVVNNYRDIDTDRKAGKHTLAVRLGRKATRVQFAFGHGVALVVLAALWYRARLGTGEAVGLAVIAAAVFAGQARALAAASDAPALIRLLGRTGQYLALYALLLAAAFVFG